VVTVDIYLALALVLLAAVAITAGTIVVAIAVSTSGRHAQADRLLVTLQALEQMGGADSPEYDEISRRYAALNQHLA
jgi:hypothetical protein